MIEPGHLLLNLGRRQAAELRQGLLSPFVHEVSELGLVVAEIQEGTCRGELLALEEQGRSGAKKRQCRQRSEATRGGLLVDTCSSGRIADLVVILEERDERRGVDPEGGRSPPLALSGVALALIRDSHT